MPLVVVDQAISKADNILGSNKPRKWLQNISAVHLILVT